MYRQVSNISRTLVANEIVDHSDVVRASAVGAAPTTSSFSTEQLASIYCAKTIASRVEKHLRFWDLVRLILEILRYMYMRGLLSNDFAQYFEITISNNTALLNLRWLK